MHLIVFDEWQGFYIILIYKAFILYNYFNDCFPFPFELGAFLYFIPVEMISQISLFSQSVSV